MIANIIIETSKLENKIEWQNNWLIISINPRTYSISIDGNCSLVQENDTIWNMLQLNSHVLRVW